jgi:hypothetical protein
MIELRKGDRVRMTPALKAKMRGDCRPGAHVGLTEPDPEQPDDGCLRCSTGHIEEFGECVGIVDGAVDFNNCKPGDPEYDETKLGPEIDVRWQPSNLRYGYPPEDLELTAE